MSRAVAAASFAFCVIFSGMIAACAAPGDPTPPHPIVPVPINDLVVRQSGSAITVTFTLPTKSTDGSLLDRAANIDIYRAAIPVGAAVDRKAPWRLLYTVPAERVDSYTSGGHFEFRDVLTQEAAVNGTGNTLAYTVRSEIEKRHVSADSNIATIRIYAPPVGVSNLRAVVTQSAVELSWTSPPASASTGVTAYKIYRAQIEPRPDSAADAGPLPLKSAFEAIGASDSDSFGDLHFEFGKSYAYVVRAIARMGADEVESADSSAAVINARDTFPPATPVGLQAATVPTTPQRPGYAELSWEISSENDLAGYYVYRSDSAEARGDRVTGELLAAPTFRDISGVPGKHYWYRVSAVDRAGNESPTSAPVQDE